MDLRSKEIIESRMRYGALLTMAEDGRFNDSVNQEIFENLMIKEEKFLAENSVPEEAWDIFIEDNFDYD